MEMSIFILQKLRMQAGMLTLRPIMFTLVHQYHYFLQHHLRILHYFGSRIFQYSWRRRSPNFLLPCVSRCPSQVCKHATHFISISEAGQFHKHITVTSKAGQEFQVLRGNRSLVPSPRIFDVCAESTQSFVWGGWDEFNILLNGVMAYNLGLDHACFKLLWVHQELYQIAIQDRSSCGDSEKCRTCWTGARKNPFIHPPELGVALDVGNINRFRHRRLEPKVVKWVFCGTDVQLCVVLGLRKLNLYVKM